MSVSGAGIAAGQKLGNYQVMSLLGAGGMGEVYRARDEKLERDVAIKVLPAAYSQDPERLRRFEQEARAAAALNHPNIVAIYDFGMLHGAPYVVSELLEGETLRERLSAGALPTRKAIEYAVQIVRGLAAAHERGIVHRDLKPDNLFVLRDGRIKILDFGLAKLTRPDETTAVTDAPTIASHTGAGVVMGTVGYMSPEQVRGAKVDHRSDIFAFGAILYEMLSGRRAFQGDTAADTSSAILREDPRDLAETGRQLPPGLEQIVRHCLEKNAEERFQSARDLAFALERMTAVSSGSSGAQVVAAYGQRRKKTLAVTAIAGAVLLGAIFLAGRWTARESGTGTRFAAVSFNRITFQRGMIWSARFSSDGTTVVYGAAWEGQPFEIFTTRPGSPESRALGFKSADVLAVSSKGELALLMNHRFRDTFSPIGTLARVPMSGGAPREVLENVQEADWSPDGEQLAVVRHLPDGSQQLEYPIGKVLYQTAGFINGMRISPKGDLIAFLDHPTRGDDVGAVAVVDLSGKKTALAENWSERGLAWAPGGDEVWYTATKRSGESGRALYAVTLEGKERLILKEPALLSLQDISRDGRLLLSHDTERRGILGRGPADAQERDWSWFDRSYARGMTPDGTTVLFDETGESARPNYVVYLRRLDGSLPVRLGHGIGQGLSADGKWALAATGVNQLIVLPTGAGDAMPVDTDGLQLDRGEWVPGAMKIVFQGREPGKPPRMWMLELPRGKPRPVTPEGTTGESISRDGKLLLARSAEGACAAFRLDGGGSQSIKCPEGRVISWLADNRSALIREGAIPARINRVDVFTGRKEIWKELMPSDRGGTYRIDGIHFSANGKSYVYTYRRVLSDLYLVEGLK